MQLGLSQKELEEIFDNATTVEDIKEALVKAILKNNKAISNKVLDKVSSDLTNELRKKGMSF